MPSSSSPRAVVPSTTNRTASAPFTAASAWRRISSEKGEDGSSSQPPVSTSRKLRSAQCAEKVRRSRVTPGSDWTTAARRPMMRLIRVDLPTLGRPTTATTAALSGSMTTKITSGGPRKAGMSGPATGIASQSVNIEERRGSKRGEWFRVRQPSSWQPPNIWGMVERVVLAEPRGFCAGVEMAIKALIWMVRIFDPPVFCYHEIVHNQWVVEAFERGRRGFRGRHHRGSRGSAGDVVGPRIGAAGGGLGPRAGGDSDRLGVSAGHQGSPRGEEDGEGRV